MVHIQVQPPRQTSVDAVLRPPVVAAVYIDGITSAKGTEFAYVFADQLLDRWGQICDDFTGWYLLTAAVPIADDSFAGSSSGISAVFHFQDNVLLTSQGVSDCASMYIP